MKKLRNKEDKPRDEVGKFSSKGVGTTSATVISVGYPPEVYEILRTLPSRSSYIRDAVIKKLQEDGLLNLEEAQSIK